MTITHLWRELADYSPRYYLSGRVHLRSDLICSTQRLRRRVFLHC